jgi:nicotinamidase-related amidase
VRKCASQQLSADGWNRQVSEYVASALTTRHGIYATVRDMFGPAKEITLRSGTSLTICAASK